MLATIAHYLHLKGATIADVCAVTNSICEVISEAAAHCTDTSLRDRLLVHRDSIDEQRTANDFIRAEVKLIRLLGAMCGNPAAQLFAEISYVFGLESDQTSFYESEADREQAKLLQRGLCDAVLGSDAEVARLMSQRRSLMIEKWVKRDEKLLSEKARHDNY